MDKSCYWGLEKSEQKNVKECCRAIVLDRTTFPSICYYRQCHNTIEKESLCKPHLVLKYVWRREVPLWIQEENPGLREIEIDLGERAPTTIIETVTQKNVQTGTQTVKGRLYNLTDQLIKRQDQVEVLVQTLINEYEIKFNALRQENKKISALELKIKEQEERFKEILRLLHNDALKTVDEKLIYLENRLLNFPST